MSDLLLVERRLINNVIVEGYYREGEFLITSEQSGKVLEYAEPLKAIAKIHERHKERLDAFSVLVKLTSTDRKRYETRLYTLRGFLEICRWSRQPKADMVMNLVWDMAESVTRKGYFSIMSDEDLYQILGERLHERQELVLRTYTIVEPSTIKTSVPLATVSERRLCRGEKH